MKSNRIILGLLISILFTNQEVLATCSDVITESTPDSRFTTTGDIVIDNTTGLTWMRCSLGLSWDGADCTGLVTSMGWDTAINTAESTSFAGQDDWRLPNIKELASIFESACFSPSINETIFPTTVANKYWSSSPYASHTSFAWIVDFDNGDNNTSGYSIRHFVRLVRSEE